MQYKDIPTTCNEHYDLISVLYHALEGAWKCETYSRDAEQAGDETLLKPPVKPQAASPKGSSTASETSKKSSLWRVR